MTRRTLQTVRACIVLLVAHAADAQQGHVLNGIGSANVAMGGTGVANPQDALGAPHWNPASIAALDRSEIAFSFEMFVPTTKISSDVAAGAFGLGFPAAAVSGSTNSDSGVSAIPAMAMVYIPKDSRFRFGISGYGIGGFGVDYPGDASNPIATTSNPITTSQPPNGFGFGAIYSNYQLLQRAAAIAYDVGAGITLSVRMSPAGSIAGTGIRSALSTDSALATLSIGF